MVIFLYNLYIFVWIQHDCLSNSSFFGSQQQCYEEVYEFWLGHWIHLIYFLPFFFFLQGRLHFMNSCSLLHIKPFLKGVHPKRKEFDPEGSKPFLFRDLPIFLFLDDNLSKCLWIFTKLGICIDIVQIWFRIANGQILSIFDRVICQQHDNGGELSFHVLFYLVPGAKRLEKWHVDEPY